MYRRAYEFPGVGVIPASTPPVASVIGGGPAGLIAAEVLAAAGSTVTVFEHMPSVGRKLLLAGRGGLNITNNEPVESLLDRYGSTASIVHDAVRQFDATALRQWCADLGEPTFVGSTGRIFPQSFRATPLLRAWLARLREQEVTFRTGERWTGWGAQGDGAPDPRLLRFCRTDASVTEIRSDVTVMALGGGSWPRVGSDGVWTSAFTEAGITINRLRSANCGLPVTWTTQFIDRFAGVPLKNVAVGVAGEWVRGDAVVVNDGLEGGPVYAQSAAVRESIDRRGYCEVIIDLHPDLAIDQVAQRLDQGRPKDSVATALKRTLGLSPVAIALIREVVGPALPISSVERAALVKRLVLRVVAEGALGRAISTAGGVALDQLDDAFMIRRLPGTFIAGEMLDWEAPTGGYLLQASFSTGIAAGRGAVRWLRER